MPETFMMSKSKHRIIMSRPLTLVCISYLACVMLASAQETTTLEDLVTTFNPNDESLFPSYDEEVLLQTPVTYIRKCKCLVTEYLSEDGECFEHPLLVDSTSSTVYNVTIEDITCPTNTASVTLPQEFLIPVEGGALFVLEAELFLTMDSYCLEHRLDFNMNLRMDTKACLPPPLLPKCCPSQTKLTVENNAENGGQVVSCSDQFEKNSKPSMDFNPQLTLQSIPLHWDKTDYSVSPVECLPGYELIKVQTEGTDEATLTYSNIAASLDWMSPNKIVSRFPPSNFCIEAETKDKGYVEYVAYFCYRNPLQIHNEICEGKTCVRKCCPVGQIYSGVNCTDWDSTESWMPVIHNSYDLEVTDENIAVTTVTGPPICPYSSFRLEPTDPFILLDNGRLKVLSVDTVYPATSYCVDLAMDDDTGEVNTWAMVCFDAPVEYECSWQRVVKVVALALSCIFIVATLFVYISVSEMSRRLASKCVISESIALLLSFLCLIILQGINHNETTVFCIATGLLFYYSTLASFFWLNVMCFDMCFTINSMLPVRDSGSKLSWFLRYSLYGWGLPLLFLIAVCICDNLPLDIHYFNIIRPNIFVTCHIPNNDYTARWTYVYGPMLVLLVVNLVLFLHVAVVLVRQQKETARVLQGAESQARQGGGGGAVSNKAKESALLCLKLFVVMGVTWITEIISFAEGNKCYVWLVTDIINCLSGFFIFLIFVCKRDVLKKFHTEMNKRWRLSRRRRDIAL